ncbi:MAG: rod shape-determining protein [Candidatus Dormibacteraeota bacterium]|nr:rod shape-determining protein [Candidatus Dormibacteraeota bacterium]
MPTRRLGIDLGTAGMRLYSRRQGMLVDEPTAVAWIPGEGGRVLAIGHRALEAAAALPAGAEVTRPIASPVIVDLPGAAALVGNLVDAERIGRSLFRPETILVVPPATSTRERRVLLGAAIAAGARRSWVVDAGTAATLGAGLDPSREVCAVLDLGAGASQFTVQDASGTLVQMALAHAGDALDRSIVARFRNRLSLHVEQRVAEQVKRAVGSALPLEVPLSTDILASDLDGRRQSWRRVTSGDVAEALAEPLDRFVAAVRRALDEVPASLRAAIWEHGLMLVGGGAQLRGLDRLLAERLELRVRVASDPQTCAVRGAVAALETMRVFRERQLYLR